jgi:Trypsin-like peptidase domain
VRAKAIWFSLALLLAPLHAAGETPATLSQAPPSSVALRKTVGFIRVVYAKGQQAWEVRGTGFFVFVDDQRLGGNRGFEYLVTNRHVAEPVEHGAKFRVLSVSLRLNLKHPGHGKASHKDQIPLGKDLRWFFPADDAVDLAVLPLAPDPAKYDYAAFPISLFATKDVIQKERIAEGDRVLFAGFLYEFPSPIRLEPILREGVLAMMPKGPMETTLHKPGHLYLADVHVSAGNSGAPLFASVGRFRSGSPASQGFPYRLLGVVSGYMAKDADLKLHVRTALEGEAKGNSGISTVVPADELKALLDSPPLQNLRDEEVALEQKKHRN